jgi:hypothetical protein
MRQNTSRISITIGQIQVTRDDGDPLVIRWQTDEESPDSPVKESPSPDAEKNGND